MDEANSTLMPPNTTTAAAAAAKGYSTKYIIRTTLLFSFFTIFIVSQNALVILAYFWKHIPRNSSSFYMLQMAIADLLVGVSMPINMVSSLVKSFESNSKYCVMETMACIACLVASTISILSLTVDRLQALRNPYNYDPEIITRRYVIRSLTIWVVPVTLFFILPMIWHSDLAQTPLKVCFTLYIMRREFVQFILLPTLFGLILAVWLTYAPILHLAFQHLRAIRDVSPEASAHVRSQLQILKTATMILLPFVAGWMPWLIVASGIVSDTKEYEHPGKKFQVLQFIAYPAITTSGINPIIYTARMPEFRRAFRALLGCKNAVEPTTMANT
jgi:hypothetical protein